MSGMFGASRPMTGHKSVEWYTPRWIFDALRIVFDLDPASPHDTETDVPAGTKYTIFDDGLAKDWFGRVLLNPPYGPDTGLWMRRMVAHGNGVALVFSRTDASWCQEAMQSATAMLFLAGRLQFIPGKENGHKRSRCGAGTVLFAWGEPCATAVQRLAPHGVFVRTANGEPSGAQSINESGEPELSCEFPHRTLAHQPVECASLSLQFNQSPRRT